MIMIFNEKFKGSFFGILGAMTYGMNPLFGLPLYQRGLTTSSVLFYRFSFALILLGGIMLLRKQSFMLHRKQFLPMVCGGILLALSCLFLFLSFHYIDGGIAATILFVYPVMVCAIMFLCFHVRQNICTIIGMIFAIGGIAGLSLGKGVESFNLSGLVFVLLSALSYAVYMVMVKVSSLKDLSAEPLTFYAMLFGLPVFLIALKCGLNLQRLPDLFCIGCALGLALFPSLFSFLFMAIAIKYIGPSKTAILGAMEPVTALLIGRIAFGESLSWLQILSICIILGSVSLVVTSKPPTLTKQKQ